MALNGRLRGSTWKIVHSAQKGKLVLMKFLGSLLASIIRYRKVLAFFVFCFLVIAPVARGAGLLDFYDGVSADGQNLNKFVYNNTEQWQNTIAGQIVGGCDDAKCPEGLKVGAIGATSSMIAGLYRNPPASGVVYVADVMKRFNVVGPVYAQTGTGYDALSPILPVWKAFRNFAYAFFAMVFIAIGLAVMFRMKLDPRTTLTIQSAIPRIIVGLLLLSFSYAIAGLLIDLMYVMIALLGVIFGEVPNFLSAKQIQDEFLNGGFAQVIGKVFATLGGGFNLASGAALGVAGLVTAGLSFMISPLGWVTALGAGLPLLIMLVIILLLLFRLFIELMRAYIIIIILIVLAPLQIAFGTIPGMPGFGSWFKNIMANILIFPGVAFVLLLAQVMVGIAGEAGDKLWVPPMIAGNILGVNAVPLLIGFGFMLIAPQVPQAIRTMFGIRGLGFAIGETLGPAALLGEAGRSGAGYFAGQKISDYAGSATGGLGVPQPTWQRVQKYAQQRRWIA